MIDQRRGRGVHRFVRRLTGTCAEIAGVVLLALMLLTVADVFMRYVFNAPLSGVWDLTQAAMVVITFLGLAYCAHTGGHIVIDLLRERLKERTRRRLDIMADMVGALVMLVLAWRSWVYMFDVAETGAASMTLLLPFWTLIAFVAFGSLLFAAVLIVTAIWPDASPEADRLGPDIS